MRKRMKSALLNLMQNVAPRMHVIDACALIVAVVLVAATISIMQTVLATRSAVERTNDAYQACQAAVEELQETSDYLTSQARLYVTSVDINHLYNYLHEIESSNRRESAIETLRQHAFDDESVEALEAARRHSDELAQIEIYALRLAASGSGLNTMPLAIAEVELTSEDRALSLTQKRAHAHELMFGDEYTNLKLRIREQVNECSTLLVNTLRVQLATSNDRLSTLVGAMHVTIILMLLVVIGVIVSTRLFLLWPMSLHEVSIREDERLIASGAAELRLLTDAYNEMYDANHARTESLTYEADHDALTGLLNRGAFEDLLTEHKHNSALLLVDVDHFKHFNDDYGHDMGDAVLVEVAATLFASFRASDFIFRIGGDEFAVIATGMDPDMRDIIASKIENVSDFLRDTSNGLPAVTVSIGVAFGSFNCADEELFQRADRALYVVKERGRDGYEFANE